MSMRSFAIVGLIGASAACHRMGPPGGATDLRCPDPSGCTNTNGTGVYTAEGGVAGIGPVQLMITHFTNTGSSVTFQGRYFLRGQTSPTPQPDQWRLLSEPGTVDGADYPGQTSAQVVSVSEQGTVPTWTLRGTDASGKTSTTPVTGDQLRQLRLRLGFRPLGAGTQQYELAFDPAPIDAAAAGQHPMHAYHLGWREVGTTREPTTYCFDAPPAGASIHADPIVFQQGIEVDPVTGAVNRNASAVTMSCYLGAPATVYRWGYDHASANSFYFDAAIQMKRASYCADADYYTVAGTRIQIGDDRINRDLPIHHLEAWWTPRGASCMNPANRRNLDRPFTGCAGKPLPACQPPPAGTTGQQFLVEGPFELPVPK